MIHAILGAAVMTGVLVQSDEQAAAFYKTLADKLKATKTLSGKLELRWGAEPSPAVFTFKAMRPNFLRQETSDQAFYGDGTNDWTYLVKEKQYSKEPADKNTINAIWLVGFEPFLGVEPESLVFEKLGAKTVDKIECVVLVYFEKEAPLDKSRLFVDRKALLPVGWELEYEGGKDRGRYLDLKLDTPMNAADFAWPPPPGAKPYAEPPPPGGEKGGGTTGG